MLLVVDDTHKFHCANMNSKNYSHYSYFAKRMPLEITNSNVQNMGSHLFFNPLIPLNSFNDLTADDDKRRIKYGVISEENAIKDLKTWKSFALPGRLQKPVLPFI